MAVVVAIVVRVAVVLEHDLLYLRRPDMLLKKLKAKRPKSIDQISPEKTLIPL